MDEAYVLLELQLADESLAATLLDPVPVGDVFRPEGVDLAAQEPEALVGGLDMHAKVVLPRKRLRAAGPAARDGLPVLHRRSGVVHLNVLLELPLASTPDIAEHTVDVFVPHMRLQQRHGGKPDAAAVALILVPRTLIAPEPQLPMLALDMPLQRRRGIKPGRGASVPGTRVRRSAQVISTHVPLQRLVLAEAAAAVGAPETLGTLVDGGVAPQPRCRHEGLAASLLGAVVLALLGVRALDVLLQVLLFEVALVAPGEIAFEGPVVGVRAEVGREAGRPVEGLGASRAFEGFDVGGELASGGVRVR